MKNFLKRFSKICLLLFVIPCLLLFSACSDGKSAYELAVENGFNGTVKEWLESLNGQDGKNGQPSSTESSYDLWQHAVESGEFSGTYLDFIENHISVVYDDMSYVASKSMASVVTISTGTYSGGSGVIFSIDSNYNAFIITNHHVVYNYNNFTLNLLGNDKSKQFSASFVGGSASYDIAVLYAENCEALKNYNAKAVEFCLDDVRFGEPCFAIGNTNLEGLSITKGNISVDSEERELSVANTSMQHRLIRHDAYISNGNSGGGLFNNRGELIGITNGGLKSSSTSSNVLVNLAIPSSVVYSITQNIIANCFGSSNTSAIVCNTGLTFETQNKSGIYNNSTGFIDFSEDVKIKQISSGCPFAESLQVGDKLISFKITTSNEIIAKNVKLKYNFEDFMILLTAGDNLELTFSREGEPYKITVSGFYEEFVNSTIA